MARKNGREIYVSGMILLIGSIYLAAQADTLFSIGSTRREGDTILISRNELFSHLRTIIIILLCFTGGIAMLRSKTIGWIINLAVILLLLTIVAGIYESNIKGVEVAGLVLIGGIILLLMAMIFLLQKSMRYKYGINNKSYYSVGILYALLILFYFFLQ